MAELSKKWDTFTDWDKASYKEFRSEALEVLKEWLEKSDLVLVKILPTDYFLSAVISNKENRKWIHLKTRDVRDKENWQEGVALRRMSSERDWRGDNFHFCSWDNLPDALLKYMKDDYDDDIFNSARNSY